MSQENVEIVRRLYEGWERGDFRAESERFDPEIDFRYEFGPETASARGLTEMRTAWREMLRQWRHWSTGRIEDVIDADPHVIAVSEVRARGRHSGLPVEMPAAATAITFRQGRIVRMVATDSREKALQAVGLSEGDLKQAESEQD
jgi:ketosteroid isomerase-like protein